MKPLPLISLVCKLGLGDDEFACRPSLACFYYDFINLALGTDAQIPPRYPEQGHER